MKTIGKKFLPLKAKRNSKNRANQNESQRETIFLTIGIGVEHQSAYSCQLKGKY